MKRLKVICSILLIFNLFETTICCNNYLDCFLNQYRRLDMNNFFKSTGNCSSIFELIDDKKSNSTLSSSKKIDFFSIKSYIRLHYATTYVQRQITNRKQSVVNVDFSISFPKNAFISNFIIDIDGKLYKSKILKRTDAAGKAQDRENYRKFEIPIELQPNSVANLYLIYEELLQRQKGSYELNLHVHPGGIIDNVDVEIYVNEKQPITTIEIPLLKKTTQFDQNNPKLDTRAIVRRINSHSALIKFQPNVVRQNEFVQALSMQPKDGLDALFTLHYDVQRDSTGGILLTDGCHFVHFFVPDVLQPIPKHVVFVLDTSTSMEGKRLTQLIKAMEQILSQLTDEDILNIIHFGSHIYVDDIANKNGFKRVIDGNNFNDYEHFHDNFKNENLPVAVPATKTNIEIALKDVQSLKAGEATNIIGAIDLALLTVKTAQKSPNYKYKPLIIMITDGEPSVGTTSHDEIIQLVTAYNGNQSSIFCLGLGRQTDYQFLKKLASLNRGLARDIDESEAMKQLQGFFHEVSAPLLNNIQFRYGVETNQITTTFFPTFFKGSQLVVAGKINDSTVLPRIIADANIGKRQFIPQFGQVSEPLDRIWAYITITQNIEYMTNNFASNNLLENTMNLALKYSFTTQLTALHVSKPNSQFVYDNSLIKPPYRPCCSLHSIPINVIKAEIRQIKFPIELVKLTTKDVYKKIPKIVTNNLINMLPQLVRSIFN